MHHFTVFYAIICNIKLFSICIYMHCLTILGEYMQNVICPASTPECLPCEQRIPSCAGLENGNNSFVGRDSFYIVCKDERTLYVRECVQGTFDPLTRSCKAVAPGPDFDICKSI